MHKRPAVSETSWLYLENRGSRGANPCLRENRVSIAWPDGGALRKASYVIVGPRTARPCGLPRRGEDQQSLAARPPNQDYLSLAMARHLTTDRKTRLERRSDRRLLVMPRVVTTHACGGEVRAGVVGRG